MRPTDNPDFTAGLPERFPVTVIMRGTPGSSRWAGENWDAVAVVVGERQASAKEGQPERHGVRYRYYDGLEIRLFEDEVESYYHNMMSPKPGCYVIARLDEEMDNPVPEPFLVTLSFDQANAYAESDDPVYAVEIPAELYRWGEAFVLQHYAPEKKRKRKLHNWKQDGTAR